MKELTLEPEDAVMVHLWVCAYCGGESQLFPEVPCRVCGETTIVTADRFAETRRGREGS